MLRGQHGTTTQGATSGSTKYFDEAFPSEQNTEQLGQGSAERVGLAGLLAAPGLRQGWAGAGWLSQGLAGRVGLARALWGRLAWPGLGGAGWLGQSFVGQVGLTRAWRSGLASENDKEDHRAPRSVSTKYFGPSEIFRLHLVILLFKLSTVDSMTV